MKKLSERMKDMLNIVVFYTRNGFAFENKKGERIDNVILLQEIKKLEDENEKLKENEIKQNKYLADLWEEYEFLLKKYNELKK